MPAPTVWTAEKDVAFLAALAETGIVKRACEAVGIVRQTAYNRYDNDAEFAKGWDAALKIGVTALEDEAHRRGFEGVDEPVFHQGVRCGSVRKYSDTLAIFLLKAHKPEKYRERFEHTGANGAPLIPPSSPEDVARRVAFLLAQGVAAQENAQESHGRS